MQRAADAPYRAAGVIGKPALVRQYTREHGRAADRFGADHLMWGSDIRTSSGIYKDTVQRFFDAAVVLSPTELRAVAHDTGKGVFVKRGVKAGGRM